MVTDRLLTWNFRDNAPISGILRAAAWHEARAIAFANSVLCPSGVDEVGYGTVSAGGSSGWRKELPPDLSEAVYLPHVYTVSPKSPATSRSAECY